MSGGPSLKPIQMWSELKPSRFVLTEAGDDNEMVIIFKQFVMSPTLSDGVCNYLDTGHLPGK